MVFMPRALTAAANLQSRDDYVASLVAWAQENLGQFSSMRDIAERERELNRYPNLDNLQEPRQVLVLDGEPLGRARAALARGEVLLEHAAAGEGTRLTLGPKYFLDLSQFTVEHAAHLISQESGEPVRPKEVAARLLCPPQELLPLALGTRHMLQLAFDLTGLARDLGEPPREMLSRQHLLVIIAEEMLAHIEKEFYQWHFFGFAPGNVYFMVQESFHGLNLKGGRFFYDESSPRRLHNHGQMVMQQTMDRQLFTLTGGIHPWDRTYHSQESVGDWLQGFTDKISYNIEDLDYLTGSLDLPGLDLALELGEQGYHMVMEVMANNPAKPQKGGMLAWDPGFKRDIMVESFQLGDLENQAIKYLNRNVNHYPRPWVSWRTLGEAGLPMPIAVKDNFLYFQPVQGDINFLVDTAFFRRRALHPIRNLKSPAGLPLAINCMAAQDRQAGFGNFVARLKEGDL